MSLFDHKSEVMFKMLHGSVHHLGNAPVASISHDAGSLPFEGRQRSQDSADLLAPEFDERELLGGVSRMIRKRARH